MAVVGEIIQKPMQTCDKHSSDEVEIYCKDCSKAICFECSRIHHHDHECESISKLSRTLRQQIPKLCKGIRDGTLSRMKAELESIQSLKIRNKNLHEEELSSMEMLQEGCIQTVKNAFKTKVEKSSEKLCKHNEKLNAREQELIQKIKQLNVHVQAHEDSQLTYGKYEIIEMNEKLKEMTRGFEEIDIKENVYVSSISSYLSHDQLERLGNCVQNILLDCSEVAQSSLSRMYEIDGSHVEVKKYESPLSPVPVSTYNNKVFITSINPLTSRDGLNTFLEANAKAMTTDVVFGDELGTALVTFEEAIDVEKLTRACQKKSLDRFYMKVQRVPVSNCVIVKGFSIDITEETLELYFESNRRSGGGDVLDLKLYRDGGICYVSFEDPNVVDDVCRRKHKVLGCTLDVRIHYQCLGQVAEEKGKTVNKFRVPEPLVMKNIDLRKYQFLVHSKTNKTALENILSNQYGKINWSGKTKSKSFTIECTLTNEMIDSKKIEETWRENIEAEVTRFFSLLVVEKHSTVPDAWSTIVDEMQSIRVSKPDDVFVILEKTDIYIVGYKHAVEDLSKQMTALIQKMQEA